MSLLARTAPLAGYRDAPEWRGLHPAAEDPGAAGFSGVGARTLGGQLWDRLCRNDNSCRWTGKRLALFRAFLTAGLDLADRADDSYGVIGDLRADAFEVYVDIDWTEAGLAEAATGQDLFRLLVWEFHALTFRKRVPPVPPRQGGPRRAHRGDPARPDRRARSAYLDSKADEALHLVARLHIGARRFRRYAAVAGHLSPDRPGPVMPWPSLRFGATSETWP